MHRLSFRIAGTAATVGAALALAACGSSSSNSSAAGGGSSPKTTGALTIGTSSTSGATYLTGAGKRAVYMFAADHNGTSNCNGACAQAWPPVVATSTPGVSGSAVAADLGTINRTGGGTQVTYKGHPLYYFIEDRSAGSTKGEGSKAFGATWWLLSPSGARLTHAASSGTSTSAGGSTSSGGGGAYG